MSVKINGMAKMLRDLESKVGQSKMQSLSSQALKRAGGGMIRAMKQNFQSFKDTGASIDEMEIVFRHGERGVEKGTIRWRGPRNRYKIIHLNEWGTINNPNPRGKGTIDRTLQSEKSAYRKTIKDTLKRGV